MVTVSVITPAYNEEQFLPAMLASLRQQTYEDWELLLVDDGSTDRTAAVIEEWAAIDPRISAVSVGTKLGKVAAFNVAYSASTGDLICHVGADDLLPPGSLSTRVTNLSGAPHRAVLLGKLQMINVDGRVVSPPLPRGHNGSQSSAGATYSRPLTDLLFPIPESLPSEDIWLGSGAVGSAQEVRNSLETILLYRIHEGNSNPRHKTFLSMSQAIHDRHQALSLLMSSDVPLSPSSREIIRARIIAEDLRYGGDHIGLITNPDILLVDKLALLSMSHPSLWRLRQRLGIAATGWRGR